MAVKELLKPTSKSGEIGRFNRAVLIEPFQLTLKFHSFIPFGMKSTRRIFLHTLHVLLNINTGHISAVINTIKTKGKFF